MKTFKERAQEEIDKFGYESSPTSALALLCEALEKLEYFETTLKYIGREDIIKDCEENA